MKFDDFEPHLWVDLIVTLIKSVKDDYLGPRYHYTAYQQDEFRGLRHETARRIQYYVY